MIDDLPEGWAAARIGEVVDLNPRHPPDLDPGLLVTFVPMAAVAEEGWALNTTQSRPLGAIRKGYTHCADGDVVFAKITPCMENGKAGVARGLMNGLGCGTTELHVLRPRGGIDPAMIYHFIHQESFREDASRNFTGTAGQLRVPTSFIRDAAIPLPPIEEQHRIVTKLEALLADVTASQRRLERISTLLKRFRQSVLAAACSGRLTEDWREKQGVAGVDVESVHAGVPPRWKLVCVGDVVEDVKYGTAAKCSRDKKGVPVLRIPNVVNGSVDHADLKYAMLRSRERDALKLQLGDILLIRSNGSVSLVGKCAVVRAAEKGFAYAGYLIRLRPAREAVAPDFLNMVLGSYSIRLQIELEARSTSGVNNINSEELRALSFLLPPVPEQAEILARVQAAFEVADRVDAGYRKAKVHVDRIGRSLLATAFRGELVPTEAELARQAGRDYEPAAALLDRILAEKSSNIERAARMRSVGRQRPRVSGRVSPAQASRARGK